MTDGTASAVNHGLLNEVTVVIVTYNSAHCLPEICHHFAACPYIIVAYSISKDASVTVFKGLGAQIHTHAAWKGFAEQRNRLLQYCTYDIFLDADVVITQKPQSEVQAAVKTRKPDEWKAYWLEVVFGHPLKRVLSRKSLPCFIRREILIAFDGVVHEHAKLTQTNLQYHTFNSPLPHYCRETAYDNLKKLTRYAMLGAAKRAKKVVKATCCVDRYMQYERSFACIFFKLGCIKGRSSFLIALEFFFRQATLKYDHQWLNYNVQR